MLSFTDVHDIEAHKRQAGIVGYKKAQEAIPPSASCIALAGAFGEELSRIVPALAVGFVTSGWVMGAQ